MACLGPCHLQRQCTVIAKVATGRIGAAIAGNQHETLMAACSHTNRQARHDGIPNIVSLTLLRRLERPKSTVRKDALFHVALVAPVAPMLPRSPEATHGSLF